MPNAAPTASSGSPRAFYLWVLKANRARLFYEALGGEEIGEKTEQLGKHPFAEVAYGWRDLTLLVIDP